MELLEKLAQPVALCTGMVLFLSAGVRESVLTLGRPRHQVVAEVDIVAQHGAVGVGTPYPVRI